MIDRRVLATFAALAAMLVPVTALAAVQSDQAVPGTGTTTPPPAEATDEATDEARRVRVELRELERAWSEGGGRFGYPFWEKAGQRWAARQITSSMYREYVTGYRDRLRAGCELLEGAQVETSEAEQVRDLVRDACRERVDALRDQQRWLDDLVRRDGSDAPTGADAVALEERIAERRLAWEQALQASYRDARLALDLAQDELDSSGLERLAEDAFI